MSSESKRKHEEEEATEIFARKPKHLFQINILIGAGETIRTLGERHTKVQKHNKLNRITVNRTHFKWEKKR